jgi:hypothetical protein
MIKLNMYLEKKDKNNDDWLIAGKLSFPEDPDYLEPFDNILQSRSRVALQKAAIQLLKEDDNVEAVKCTCDWKDATISPEPHGRFEFVMDHKSFVAPRETYMTEMENIVSTSNGLVRKDPPQDIGSPKEHLYSDEIYGAMI